MTSLSRWGFLPLLSLSLWACGEDPSPTVDGDAGWQADAGHHEAEDASGLRGDGGETPQDGEPPLEDGGPSGECAVAHLYDPLQSETLLQWPDGLWAVEDAQRPGGQRLRLTEENAPWVRRVPNLMKDTVHDLNELGGFGRGAAAFFRFSGPVDLEPTEEAPYEGEALLWYDLDTQPPSPVPFAVHLGDEGSTVFLEPLRPLRAGARHVVAVRGALTAAQGACIDRAPVMHRLLRGEVEDARLEASAASLAAALAQIDVPEGQILSASVFQTHQDHWAVAQAAADVATQQYAWLERPRCEDQLEWLYCEGSFEATDYRDGRAILTGTPQGQWTLPVSLWLPKNPQGPVPVIVFGHGIGGDRQHARDVVWEVASEGFAVVAVDALLHGRHPTSVGGSGTDAAMQFLGLDINQLKIDGLALRGHFNQTALDRLQLVSLLRQASDIDGDGEADLDGERIAYWGISLGSMLAPALLALDEHIGAAILSVGGGRLMSFVTETENIRQLRPMIYNLAGGEANLRRLLPVAQTVVDAADPASWGSLVHGEGRLGAGAGPHVLLPVADQDETVPPVSGRALARAMRLAHVGPVVTPVSLLAQVAAPFEAPGSVVGAYFQYDRVSRRQGAEAADHNNTATSKEGSAQGLAFLESWLEGAARVIDPYELLQTPALGGQR